MKKNKKLILRTLLLITVFIGVLALGKIFFGKTEQHQASNHGQKDRFYAYSGSSDSSDGIALSACWESSSDPSTVCAGTSFGNCVTYCGTCYYYYTDYGLLGPDCSGVGNYCVGTNYGSPNGCGSCWGTKGTDCSGAGYYCEGTSYGSPTGCGTCWGTRGTDCSGAGNYCVGVNYGSPTGCGSCWGTKTDGACCAYDACDSANVSLYHTNECCTGKCLGYRCGTIPVCTDSSWTPDPSDVCSGTSFTQTSNCGTTRAATGTKTVGNCCTYDACDNANTSLYYTNQCCTGTCLGYRCGTKPLPVAGCGGSCTSDTDCQSGLTCSPYTSTCTGSSCTCSPTNPGCAANTCAGTSCDDGCNWLPGTKNCSAPTCVCGQFSCLDSCGANTCCPPVGPTVSGCNGLCTGYGDYICATGLTCYPTLVQNTDQGNCRLPSNLSSISCTTPLGSINGVCGPAAKTYQATDTAFYGALCAPGTGTANPGSPSFPAAGSGTSWTCSGLNGGLSITCNAQRNNYACSGTAPNGSTQKKCSGSDAGLTSPASWQPVSSCTGGKCEYTVCTPSCDCVSVNCGLKECGKKPTYAIDSCGVLDCSSKSCTPKDCGDCNSGNWHEVAP